MEAVQKTQIARLLATENITVVQGNVSTASFNVKTRVLTLPMWKDITSVTEDHLVGHEVGHALYTPEDGWHDAVCDASRGPSFKSYLNVTEDARIEKLVQRKYPGLKKSFIKSYRAMLASGFFGGDIDTINEMGFIDRINTYYKCGVSAGVIFSEEEKTFLPMLDALESWDDAEKAAEILFDYCLEEEEKKQEDTEEDEADQETAGEEDGEDETEASSGDNDGEEETDGSPEKGEGESGEGDLDTDTDCDTDASEEEESDSSPDNGREGGTCNPNKKDISSKTDDALRENIESQMVKHTGGEVFNLTLDSMKKWKNRVIGYKDILNEVRGIKRIDIDFEKDDESRYYSTKFNPKSLVDIEFFGTRLYRAYQNSNKKIVNHMVKEFEMRKSASAYARTNISKTGVIDTLKMNNYRLTDDIFRKVSTVEDGKNHGFIMYLDMSGSMCDYMYETVEQTIMLAQFCKQIGVPFRVYGFTDSVTNPNLEGQSENPSEEGENILGPASQGNGRLLELFSNNMNAPDMSMMIKTILVQYYQYAKQGTVSKTRKFDDELSIYNVRYSSGLNRLFNLGGTPLNLAMTIGIPLGLEFRKKYNIEVMNTFVLSDGASASMGVQVNGRRCRITNLGGYMPTSKAYVSVLNPFTKKQYVVKQNALGRSTSETEIVFNMYRETVGGNLIGYRIERQRQTDISCIVTDLRGAYGGEHAHWENMKTQGWTQLTNPAYYDEVFIIGSKALTTVSNAMSDLEEKVGIPLSKAKLRTAFSKSQNSTKNSRKMLTELAKRIA